MALIVESRYKTGIRPEGMVLMQSKSVRGYFTRERWLLGKTPIEMSRLLGFAVGRMALGAKIYALSVIPTNDQFRFAGHTHWSGGKPVGGALELWPEKQSEVDRRWMRSPEVRAKDNVRASWGANGPERLVKVETKSPHDPIVSDRIQYPPGAGVEQWELLIPLPALLVRELGPDERYFP